MEQGRKKIAFSIKADFLKEPALFQTVPKENFPGGSVYQTIWCVLHQTQNIFRLIVKFQKECSSSVTTHGILKKVNFLPD